jgi:hypothetical protein
MYNLIIITAIGNYKVIMVPSKEDPTNDDLMAMFLETKKDIEAGCFMEGWTPEALAGPPGVFAIGDGLEILAYHVERLTDIEVPKEDTEWNDPLSKPISFTIPYLGMELHVKTVSKPVAGAPVILCYEVNGETPADVLEPSKLTEIIASYIENDVGLSVNDFLLYVVDDGKARNFSQAVSYLEELEDTHKLITTAKTGKAWEGWKGEPD